MPNEEPRDEEERKRTLPISQAPFPNQLFAQEMNLSEYQADSESHPVVH